MITASDLSNRGVNPEALTAREHQVLTLVESYVRVAGEAPSYGWIGRRLGVSRQRAAQFIDSLRRKKWLDDRPLSKSQVGRR